MKQITIFLLLFSLQLNAQVRDSLVDINATKLIDPVAVCKIIEFQFRVENNLYFEKSKVYVCPQSLPVEIALIDILTNQPIPWETIWTVNGNINSSTNSSITLSSVDFNDDVADLVCSFTEDSGPSWELKLTVKRNLKLEWSESSGNYSFDPNTLPEYINSYGGPATELGIPWNFIETNGNETMNVKTKPSKGYYAVNVTSNNPDLNINPTMISEPSSEVVLTYNNNIHSIIDVKGCSNEAELKIYTESPQHITLEFYRVCESNDDLQIVDVGEMVATPLDIIIDPGLDMSIDLWANPASWLQGDDMLWLNPDDGLRYVAAGEDLIASTPIAPHHLNCPSNYDIATAMEAANEIYNKIGVHIVGVAIVDLNVNFDIFDNDNILGFNEQQNLHGLRDVSGFLADGDTEIYVVQDLGGNTAGRASGFGVNTLALDRLNSTESTLSHEIGHAKYGLFHPKDQFNGGIVDQKYIKNFMFYTSTGRENVIRRYQFHLIH